MAKHPYSLYYRLLPASSRSAFGLFSWIRWKEVPCVVISSHSWRPKCKNLSDIAGDPRWWARFSIETLGARRNPYGTARHQGTGRGGDASASIWGTSIWGEGKHQGAHATILKILDAKDCRNIYSIISFPSWFPITNLRVNPCSTPLIYEFLL